MMHIARAYFIKAGYPDEPLSNPQLHVSADEMKKTPTTPYIITHLQANSSQKTLDPFTVLTGCASRSILKTAALK